MCASYEDLIYEQTSTSHYGCIDHIRVIGRTDGQGGTVISTEYSEANSLVMFRDRGEAIWRCFVSNDGAERVAFASGATREELVRTEGLTAYWFNQNTGTCSAITTSKGRYSNVGILPGEDY